MGWGWQVSRAAFYRSEADIGPSLQELMATAEPPNFSGMLHREIAIQKLLRAGKSWTGAIRQPFCVLLDRERTERREEPVKKDDLFGDCPDLGSVSVLLEDSDKNRRFDHILVTADS